MRQCQRDTTIKNIWPPTQQTTSFLTSYFIWAPQGDSYSIPGATWHFNNIWSLSTAFHPEVFFPSIYRVTPSFLVRNNIQPYTYAAVYLTHTAHKAGWLIITAPKTPTATLRTTRHLLQPQASCCGPEVAHPIHAPSSLMKSFREWTVKSYWAEKGSSIFQGDTLLGDTSSQSGLNPGKQEL